MANVTIIENSPMLGRYFAHFLDAAGVNHQTFRAWRGEASFPTGGFGSYILTGDFHNITSGLKEYHLRELEFLESIRGRRVFGSCFAHQLIARHRGGKVVRRDSRLLGWERIDVTGEHPALEGIPEFTAVCLNTDEVEEPPGSARLIAESENCRCQVLAYGEDVLTCQAHPEIDAARNHFALDAAALLLSGGPCAAFRDFRRARRRAGGGGDEFTRQIVKWLAGG